MTTLKNLKKYKDEYCTKFMLNQVDFVKKQCNIAPPKRMFILGSWNGREYFLCDDKIYVANFDYPHSDKNDYRNAKPSSFLSLYIITLKNKEVVNFETIIPDDTTPRFREVAGFKNKIDITKRLYTKEDFLIWYNSPSQINEFVDVSYKKAVEFLQNYKKITFKTDIYLFYAKRDNDLSWCFFIHAKDLKTGLDFKIYTDGGLQSYFPDNPRKVFVEDLSGKATKCQLRQCKKEFMEFYNQDCKELECKNFWALDFVKQCIQPVEKEHGWPICDVFSGEFDNILVDDFLSYDKKPYFLISDKRRKITKIAAISFFKPEYKSTGIYKSGTFKRNHWNIDKETIEKLVEFLKAPCTIEHDRFASCCAYERRYANPDIKTNWQELINIYNNNTGEVHGDEFILPLDLEMPDYTKLVRSRLKMLSGEK